MKSGLILAIILQVLVVSAGKAQVKRSTFNQFRVPAQARLNLLNTNHPPAKTSLNRKPENSGQARFLQTYDHILSGSQSEEEKTQNCFSSETLFERALVRGKFDEDYGPWQPTALVGYIRQQASGAELMLYLSQGLDIWNAALGELPNWGPAAGTEILEYRGTTFIVPKLSYHYHSMFIGGRLDASYYNVKERQDFRLTPQVGPSLSPFVNLNIGYSFSLLGKKPDYLNPFKLSIYIILPRISRMGG